MLRHPPPIVDPHSRHLWSPMMSSPLLYQTMPRNAPMPGRISMVTKSTSERTLFLDRRTIKSTLSKYSCDDSSVSHFSAGLQRSLGSRCPRGRTWCLLLVSHSSINHLGKRCLREMSSSIDGCAASFDDRSDALSSSSGVVSVRMSSSCLLLQSLISRDVE